MDMNDEDVGEGNDCTWQEFIDEHFPDYVRGAIYEHTHSFMFNPHKKETILRIISDPLSLIELKKRLDRQSFSTALGNNGSDTPRITDVIDDKLYQIAFNDVFYDEVQERDNGENYTYALLHPWDYLNEEPALKDEAENCSYCDGTGYMYWKKGDDGEWTSELQSDQYEKIYNDIKDNHPEFLDEFRSVYGHKRPDGTYMPLNDHELEVFCQHYGQKCRFCHGTGKDYDAEDLAFWSDDQQTRAVEKSQTEGIEESLENWAISFNYEWDQMQYQSKDKVEVVYNTVLDLLNMEHYPNETLSTITNLFDLFFDRTESLTKGLD